MLVKKNTIKEHVKEQYENRMASDCWAKLDEAIDMILERASQRAKENGRNTIQGKDL